MTLKYTPGTLIQKPNRRFATVNQTSEIYPAFTVSSLRYLIFNRKTNGFDKCIYRVNRKILIDLDLLETWIDEKQGALDRDWETVKAGYISEV